MNIDNPRKRKIPGNMDQVFIVSYYELLKYLRSKRLLGTIAVIAVILSLIYVLPPALGSPYTGERNVDLNVYEIYEIPPEFQPFFISMNLSEYRSMANITPVDRIDTPLSITVNGTILPSTEWQEIPGESLSILNISLKGISFIIFKGNLTSSDVVATYEFKTNTIDFSLGFLSFAEILIIICVTLFGADALVSEFQNRTAYLLFPNPIKKAVMFAGKFIASFVASLAMISLYYLVVVILSFITIDDLAPYFHISFGFAILFLLAALAMAFFIGALLKGSTGAIVLTFFLLIMIIPIIESVGMVAGAKPWYLFTFAAHSLIYSIQIDDYPQDATMDFGGGFSIYQFYPELELSAIVLAIYAIVFIVISLILFKRKQLTG